MPKAKKKNENKNDSFLPVLLHTAYFKGLVNDSMNEKSCTSW